MGANLNQQETFLGTLEQAHFCFIQCYSRFWIIPRLYSEVSSLEFIGVRLLSTNHNFIVLAVMFL